MPASADRTAGLGKATADRIVDEGLRLFAENGFQGTTVGEIERRAGLTPRAGALYKHFPSKEAVLEAAFERHVAELEAIGSRTSSGASRKGWWTVHTTRGHASSDRRWRRASSPRAIRRRSRWRWWA